MTSTVLKERIAKATDKIAKKENTIVKKTALIAKKNGLIETGIKEFGDSFDKRWLESEIEWLRSDIKRLGDEIAETKNTLAKYEKQLAGELEKEALFASEIPDSMKQMQTELTDRWNAWDLERQAFLIKEYDRMHYREFFSKYKGSDYNLIHMTTEEIVKRNEKDAEALILNLYNRVKEITGEVTDWNGICVTQGAYGSVLNGLVIGKEGRAEVESILAGGYNIQRLHVRVLVKAR